MRVLFATDGSDASAAAIKLMAALPFRKGTAIRVVSVAVNWMVPMGGFEPAPIADFAAFEQAQLDAAADAVADAANALKREGVVVESEVREGQPGYEIIRAAEDFQADLAVVGSKDLKGLEGFVLGSVARDVAHHAPCSVLIAREVNNRVATVILAADGSPHANQAVQLTAALPLPRVSKVIAVHVMPLPGMYRLQPPDMPEGTLRAQRQHLVKTACDRLATAGKLAVPEVREGDPATGILAAASDHHADLIIAGARGHSFIENLLVGSVADRLLKSATCSLLIVR